jgi:tetratricopeptide (TPR) repeat protein
LSRDSVVIGVAGVFFGVLIGWIIGSQQASAPRVAPATAQQSAPPPAQTAAPLDESRAAALRAAAERDPKDAGTRVQLGNLYFDAERFDEASRWYEAALSTDPRNVNASTDLGISYYYMNQPDRALAQFDKSLAIDPNHSKTLLNVGIVRAFGKQDLEGAARSWQRVLEVAPNSPEARAAKQALEGVRTAHPDVTGGASSDRKSRPPQ